MDPHYNLLPEQRRLQRLVDQYKANAQLTKSILVQSCTRQPEHCWTVEPGRLKIPAMAEASNRNFLELMKQGWIAGYPPWFHNFWIKPAKCETEEEKTRLLNFLRAIEDGKMEKMKQLLPDIDPNLRLAVEGNRTESLLEWAVEKAREPEAIRLLLKAGAGVKGIWLTHKAVGRGDNEILADLLQAGADPNGGSPKEGPLTAACWGDAEAVRLLLEAGARTDRTTTIYITNNRPVKKVSPLMAAAYAGQPQIAKLLLEAGADLRAKDEKGNTAVAWARISRAKKKAEKIIALLQEAGLSESASESDLPEQADFSERGKSPEFKRALELAKKLTKSAPEPVDLDTGELNGVRAFKIRDSRKALDILEEIRPELAALGAYAFLSERLMEYDTTYLVLIPEPDYRKAIIAFETPVGQSIDCHDLNKWLKKLEEKEPFVITHIAPDLVRARFNGKLNDSKWVASQIHKICSDAMDSPVPKLAKHLEKSGELFLWWD